VVAQKIPDSAGNRISVAQPITDLQNELSQLVIRNLVQGKVVKNGIRTIRVTLAEEGARGVTQHFAAISS
jgi:hypothetical protein